MTELSKVYDPSQVEQRWYRVWLEQKYFHADEQAPKAPYSIVIPPPNVTGSLHMGHALFATIQDILIRWRRMQAYNAMWLPGVDHAGIATQMVVERDLMRREGKSRHDLGREAFLSRVWEWKEKNGHRIVEQLMEMGCSLDWDRARFTLDEGLSVAVREAFVRLYEEGLIYRARRLINWCSRCASAISDLEVEHEETQGTLWHVAYPVTGSDEKLIVATTRPETLLGDTAVAVHPEDDRFKHLIGRTADLPLTDRKIPIIGDAILVDREFGTGAVKVTPGHDFNDFETGQRHGLDAIAVFDLGGRLNDNAPARYRGLTVAEARERVVADLQAAGLLVKTEPHTLSIGRCQRCETIVEPTLSLQWFVKTAPLAAPAIEAVESGKTRFVPEAWTKTYMHWMRNIKDWCVSRQLWWGHRIPAWYCEKCGEPTVAREAPEKCIHCGHSSLKQDDDVLDTWFSSGLWPFSTLGWPNQTRELKTFYPTSVMETGYDILFFWVARMMMMGLHFMKKVPFRTVFLHALVVDENGDKMSKVKGNVVDPLDVIHGATREQLLQKARDGGAPDAALQNIERTFAEGIPASGADALRFTLAAMAAQGRNIRLSIKRVEGYRHFANKLWNAARFVLMNLEGYDADRFADDVSGGLRDRITIADRWILSRLQRCAKEVDEALEAFKFNEAAQAIYAFLWNELCDWYIELAKPQLGDADRRFLTQGVLATALETASRLLHPFMPFVTEEIWQQIPKPAGTPQSIMITLFPMADGSFVDEEAEATMRDVQEIVVAGRNARAEYDLKEIALTVIAADEGWYERLAEQGELAKGILRTSFFEVAKPGAAPPSTVQIQVTAGGNTVALNFPDAGERAAVVANIDKKLAKAEKDRASVEAKLQNPSFVDRAPAEIVEKERARLADNLKRIETLRASRARLET